jgi:hypothetical protein
VESDFFWLCAIVQLLVSVRFSVRVRRLRKRQVTVQVLKLARGQRQDSWLASAVIWGMILCKTLPYSDALYLAGSAGLIWLIVRSGQRASVLARESLE